MDLSKVVVAAVLSVLCGAALVLGWSHRYEEKYITLPVNQFTFASEGTFQLKYLINDTYSNGNPDAPILFYCGNEAAIELFAEHTDFIWEFAPKIKALIVFAEHRYYGKSVPSGSFSLNGTNYYDYLTIEQTLADFASLVEHLNRNSSRNRPTIAIGGSYGGILAALFRMKYPLLVAGALGASAPLKQFSNLTPCDGYSKTITKAFQTAYNEHCTSNIMRSWTVFRDVAFSAGGVDFFNEVFDFCEPWDSPMAVNDFLDTLSEAYWHMAMTNFPYEANVYTRLPANPIKEFCSHLDVDYYGRDLVKAFRKAIEVYTNFQGEKKCFEFPKHHVMTQSDNEAWNYQRCTELATGICDAPDDNMFPPGGASFEEVIESCRQTYGAEVDRAANRINDHFGIDSLSTSRMATKIILSNGLQDPWSAASVLEPFNSEILVINIPEGAHHIDLRHSNKLDPPSVTNARALEQIYIKKWIREFRSQRYHFM